jgi:hypothetical protein
MGRSGVLSQETKEGGLMGLGERAGQLHTCKQIITALLPPLRWQPRISSWHKYEAEQWALM